MFFGPHFYHFEGLVPFSDPHAYFKPVVLPRALSLGHVDLGLHEWPWLWSSSFIKYNRRALKPMVSYRVIPIATGFTEVRDIPGLMKNEHLVLI